MGGRKRAKKKKEKKREKKKEKKGREQTAARRFSEARAASSLAASPLKRHARPLSQLSLQVTCYTHVTAVWRVTARLTSRSEAARSWSACWLRKERLSCRPGCSRAQPSACW
eukprot:438583-Rhodomonas_salina.1